MNQDMDEGDFAEVTVPAQDGIGKVRVILKAVPESAQGGCDGCFGELRYLKYPGDPDSDASYCDFLQVQCSKKQFIMTAHCETSTTMMVLYKLEGT